MKPLLNTAFIVALGLTVGACTIVTNPSSGSSAAGSSEQAGFLNRQQQITTFASVNLERLKTDMAAGQGEYLGSLATLMGIASSDQPAFSPSPSKNSRCCFQQTAPPPQSC